MDPASARPSPAIRAIITPGPQLQPYTLGDNEYGKPALGYLAVKDLLGDELFKKALLEYMTRWHGKHPIPWDFFKSINSGSGQDLNWIWNRWFFANSHIDLEIVNVKTVAGTTTVHVQNKVGLTAPFDLVVSYTDDSVSSFHLSPAVWEKTESEAMITLNTTKAVQSVKLEGGIFMDADTKDNEWRANMAKVIKSVKSTKAKPKRPKHK